MYTFAHIQVNGKPIPFQLNEKTDTLFCPFPEIKCLKSTEIQTKLADIVGITFNETHIYISNATAYLATHNHTLSETTTKYKPIYGSQHSSTDWSQSAPSLSTLSFLNSSNKIQHSNSSPRLALVRSLNIDSLMGPEDSVTYRETGTFLQEFSAVRDKHVANTIKTIVTQKTLALFIKMSALPHTNPIKKTQMQIMKVLLNDIIEPIFQACFRDIEPSELLCDFFISAMLRTMKMEIHNNKTYSTKHLLRTAPEEFEHQVYNDTIIMLRPWLFFVSNDKRLIAALECKIDKKTWMQLNQIKDNLKNNPTSTKLFHNQIAQLRAAVVEFCMAMQQQAIAMHHLSTQYKRQENIISALSTPTSKITYLSFKTLILKLLGDISNEVIDTILTDIRIMLRNLVTKSPNANSFLEKLFENDSDKDFYLLDAWDMQFIVYWQKLVPHSPTLTKGTQRTKSRVDPRVQYFVNTFEAFILAQLNATPRPAEEAAASSSMAMM